MTSISVTPGKNNIGAYINNINLNKLEDSLLKQIKVWLKNKSEDRKKSIASASRIYIIINVTLRPISVHFARIWACDISFEPHRPPYEQVMGEFASSELRAARPQRAKMSFYYYIKYQ